MFEDLSARSKLDGEEIARLKKERDELLQRNAAANEKASEVLKELEMERDLRRKAESRATALQRKVDEDVEVVRSLRAELDDAVKGKLSAENAATKLEKEAAYTRRALQAESDEHDLLQAAVGVVLNALNVTEPVETSPLVARVGGITARVGQLEESAFHAGITQAFTVAHAHYEKEINLKVMSEGFPSTYEDEELEEMEKMVAPLAKNLADNLKEMVLPPRK